MTRSYGTRDGEPTGGAVLEKRIALWGAPESGRTTFVAMIPEAAEERSRALGHGGGRNHARRWKVFGTDDATQRLLRHTDQALLHEHRFPDEPDGSVDTAEPTRYRFLFRRDPRVVPLHRLTDHCRFVATITELPDPSTRRDAVKQTLADCTGLIVLFDPTDASGTGEEAIRALDRVLTEAAADLQPRTDPRGLLPFEPAVCVTKIDDMTLYREARLGAWAELGRDGRVRVRDPEAYFHRLCERDGPCPNPAAAELPGILERHFGRIRYYATSAAGFRRSAGRIDPENCRNVDPHGNRLDGPPHPQGVLEPILGMRAVRIAKRG
ncbi:hypothetical protein ACWGR4_47435 [Embleya sp. NPDC055664]